EVERLRLTWVNPRTLPAEDASRVLGQAIEREYRLADLLRRPHVSYEQLMTLPQAQGADNLTPVEREQVEISIKYAGYIDRQAEEVARNAHHENTRLPLDLDYHTVKGLSVEIRQKLNLHKPETLGQAARISGVTPAAISLLLIHLRKSLKQAA
ncbi:MAG: tRNA uridine-5-carboxymethylaminomethyl(34) synthesis enzyme MnmG, partial [Burkholderiales bacterium]